MNGNEPATKDHLSSETTFVWPMAWSFKTVSTVLVTASDTNRHTKDNRKLVLFYTIAEASVALTEEIITDCSSSKRKEKQNIKYAYISVPQALSIDDQSTKIWQTVVLEY